VNVTGDVNAVSMIQNYLILRSSSMILRITGKFHIIFEPKSE
jgi:hypothetical protein